MLKNANHLKVLVIRATDGEIGTVDQLYFDDESWAIRYLTVKTGGWLGGRRVLISPIAVVHTNWQAKRLDVALTKSKWRIAPISIRTNPSRGSTRQHTWDITGIPIIGAVHFCGDQGITRRDWLLKSLLRKRPKRWKESRKSRRIHYCPMALAGPEPGHLGLFNSHHRLAAPVSPWEWLKIGGGAPPILTRHGWLIVYHGVSEIDKANYDAHQLCYSAGAMVLSKEHPQMIRYRSVEPVLTPALPQECHGTVPHVVFPTGIDRRDDLGLPNRFDVYYGMADYRIGVARLDMPEVLPPEGVADPPEAKV